MSTSTEDVRSVSNGDWGQEDRLGHNHVQHSAMATTSQSAARDTAAGQSNGKEKGNIIGLEDIGEQSEDNDDNAPSDYEMKKEGGSGSLTSLRYTPQVSETGGDAAEHSDSVIATIHANSFAVLEDLHNMEDADGLSDVSLTDIPGDRPSKPVRVEDRKGSVPTIRVQAEERDGEELAKSFESLALNDYAL